MEERKRLFEEKLSEARGFRHIVDAIFKSSKPVIGHNCFLGDLNSNSGPILIQET